MVTNQEIIRQLYLMAQLLELKGENLFRIRAYEKAAQALSAVTQKIAEMSEEELLAIPGIGLGMIAHIHEILNTGAMKELLILRKKFPDSLLKLLEIPGLGPKRAKILFEKLKIGSLEALKKAAQEGNLRDLPGFGEKTEENILKGIGFAQAAHKRMLLWDARFVLEDLMETLKACPGLVDLAPAGSLRRGKETVGDLDILCTARDPAKTIEFFTKLPRIERIVAAGETKATVWLKDQIQCDLRVVAPDEFGAALMYFTGSKEHNVALREYALKLGLTINEYGLFKRKGDTSDKGDKGKKIAGRTEEETYKALGLEWIPPELRENRGEIEVARHKRLPKLIEFKDIKGDFHNHTNLTDGISSLEEMAEAGRALGWEWIFVGDHSQSLKITKGLNPQSLHQTIAQARDLNQRYRDFRVFRSMEVDILKDGQLDYEDKDLEAIDCVVASIHTSMNQSEDEMTNRILRALKNPHVDILAHLSGRLLNQREPYQVDVEKILEACRKSKTALEINGQPQRQDLFDIHARRAKELGVPLALTTDAHAANQLAYMEIALIVARRAWLQKEEILNSLSAQDIIAWLNERR